MKNDISSITVGTVKNGVIAILAVISTKLGILYPILLLLMLSMIVDYLTGVIAAGYRKKLSSYLGMWGIIKKLMYAVVITVAIASDWVILNVTADLGIVLPATTFFGLLVSLWSIFNEFISILENLLLMEMELPAFLLSFLKKFKHLVEIKGDELSNEIEKNK